MAGRLPELTRDELAVRLASAALAPAAVEALFAHYQTLRRWAPRVSLIGPGTVHEAVERHYLESLAARPWVPAGSRLLDVGSGGGFPGMVLAAADPSLDVTLVEARQRKWAFLEAARRAASLSCRCLNARVGAAPNAALPVDLDLVTLRALRLEPPALSELARRLGEGGAVLFWAGREDPELPKELTWTDATDLPGRNRRLLRAARA